MNTTLRPITSEAQQLLSYIPLAAVLGGIAFLLMLMINRGRRIGRCFVWTIFVFLYGVDDGAKNIGESLNMLEEE